MKKVSSFQSQISNLKFLSLLLLFSLCHSCMFYQRPARITSPSDAMQEVGWWDRPGFQDDLDQESLLRAIERNRDYLNRLPPDRIIRYGDREYRVAEVMDSFTHLVTILKESKDPAELNRKIIRDFDIFQSVGRDNKKNVLFTGYYEPLLRGSLEKNEIYRYPLYAPPEDLLVIRLGEFRKRFAGESIVARLKDNTVVPYYNRAEIDGERIIENSGLKIAWLKDPIDAFFLHIQGSGIIEMEDGSTLNVNYSQSNGRPYRSIGRLLIEEGKIPKEKMSMKAIREYLTSHPEEMEHILYHNESYVFFRTVEEGPIGSISVPMTAGRSIASDKKLFPKGGLAYIETEIPLTDEEGNIIEWKKISRFVIDQDTGGAIKGPGRIDLFFGTGGDAGKFAGSMNRNGRLYYLIKKR